MRANFLSSDLVGLGEEHTFVKKVLDLAKVDPSD